MDDSQPEAPRWQLLPHDPVGFFELSGEFDRKDLKRAYNRLLRIYKPEKHPAEFQRIRAAYEQLDEQLRYQGNVQQRSVPPPINWQTEPPQQEGASTAESQSAPRPVSQRLVDRLKRESPAALFAELQNKQLKAPYDYYSLALLSDIVERTTTGFAKWLADGIAQYRQDGVLKQLLHEYFRGPLDAASLAKLLPYVARAVRTDDFYPLTEPAWQVLLAERPFSEFTSTLDRCESELRDSHIVGRMAFLIHILKSAMWHEHATKESDWCARQFDFIEEHFRNIPPWLEWDVELLSLAKDYLAVRQQFAAGSPLRTKMDAALKDYFSGSQQVGDRSILACQMEILGNSDALLKEFNLDETDLFAKFYPIWSWASHDVAERHAIATEEEVNEAVWSGRARELLERLDKASKYSLIGFLWSSIGVASVISLGLLGLAVLLIGLLLQMFLLIAPLEWLIGPQAVEYGMVLAILVSIILTVVVPWKLKSYIDKKIWNPLHEKFATKFYNQQCRRELLDFQKRSRVPASYFRALFSHYASKSTTASWIHQFVSKDYAMALLAGAQRFEA